MNPLFSSMNNKETKLEKNPELEYSLAESDRTTSQVMIHSLQFLKLLVVFGSKWGLWISDCRRHCCCQWFHYRGESSVSVSESNSQKNNGELGDVSEIPWWYISAAEDETSDRESREADPTWATLGFLLLNAPQGLSKLLSRYSAARHRAS